MVVSNSRSGDGASLSEEEDQSATSNSSSLAQQPGDPAATATVSDAAVVAGRPSPIRSMDSFRARLRAARREPPGAAHVAETGGARAVQGAARSQQPQALFQWETRGHFWSALDKAEAPHDASQAKGCGSVVSKWGQMASVRLKNTTTVVRRRPSVLVLPVLLAAACLVLGLIGVHLGAKHDKESKQDDARAAASHTAASLGLVLEQSLQPLRSLELQVQLHPAMGQLGPRLEDIAQGLVGGAPVLSSLALAPFGVVRAVYSMATAAAGSGAYPTLGSEVMSPERLRPSQLQSILLSPASSAGDILTAVKPVVVVGAAANETWGNGDGDGGKGQPSTINGTCIACAALQDSGSALWGFASAGLDVGAAVGQVTSGLVQLRQEGYLYRLTLLDAETGQVLSQLDSSPPLDSGTSSVSVTVPAGGGAAANWQLEVAPEDGWEPPYTAALTAVVVVVSVVVAAFLFMALVLQQRHLMLLEAMLPKKVINVLSTGRSFYECFDSVTVLYADIVRYSNTPTGMPHWEIVKLLNDVNNIYDSLLDKHGLIKIRRSGEAFMGVGGCPNAEDPVATAVRVAQCAREMVMATAAFRSSAGQRVQIRLGLHSGPAVAAVLGTVSPRFSLLGDTVDIAYFMESTSTIMGVHVSDTTAELLNIAEDPLIILQPRGIIDIKGRGPITTFWLRVDLLVPMTTFHDHVGNTSTNLGGASAIEPSRNNGSGGGAGPSGGGATASAKAPEAAPADIACTADLAVAATLGVKGAPLVRKLSQTGLTQTRRALPDRRTRAVQGQAYEHSLLGSFTMRIDPDTIQMFQDMVARQCMGEADITAAVLRVPPRRIATTSVTTSKNGAAAGQRSTRARSRTEGDNKTEDPEEEDDDDDDDDGPSGPPGGVAERTRQGLAERIVAGEAGKGDTGAAIGQLEPVTTIAVAAATPVQAPAAAGVAAGEPTAGAAVRGVSGLVAAAHLEIEEGN